MQPHELLDALKALSSHFFQSVGPEAQRRAEEVAEELMARSRKDEDLSTAIGIIICATVILDATQRGWADG